MKEELLRIINEFQNDVDSHNLDKLPLEDRVGYTFESFIKWLEFEVKGSHRRQKV